MSNLTVIEHKEQRVLTTAQLAESYGTDTQNISKNFIRNIARYTKGIHFYQLEGEEKRQFLNHVQIDDGSKNASILYLWTEKGAFLHAKSLNTDEAWQVYEMLVDNYFQGNKKPASLEDLIIMQAQSVKDLKAKVNLLESSITQTADKTEVLEKRISNLIDIDITQPKTDVLNKYIQRYAITYLRSNFNSAWKEFDKAFYYVTGMYVDVRARNAKMSRPKWLEANGYIEEAIRIADNMLNK